MQSFSTGWLDVHVEFDDEGGGSFNCAGAIGFFQFLLDALVPEMAPVVNTIATYAEIGCHAYEVLTGDGHGSSEGDVSSSISTPFGDFQLPEPLKKICDVLGIDPNKAIGSLTDGLTGG
jgi:hypothetical protein